jgi:hypothetical protein
MNNDLPCGHRPQDGSNRFWTRLKAREEEWQNEDTCMNTTTTTTKWQQ